MINHWILGYPVFRKKNRKRTYVKLLAWSPRNIHLNYIIYKHDGGGMKIAGAWTVHYGEFHHPKVGYGPWPKACLWLIKHLFWLSYILLEVLGICCLDFFDIYWMSLGYFFGFLWYLLDVYWILFGYLKLLDSHKKHQELSLLIVITEKAAKSTYVGKSNTQAIYYA